MNLGPKRTFGRDNHSHIAQLGQISVELEGAYQRLSRRVFTYMEQQCPQISHLAGSATDKLPGTAKGSSLKAHLPAREAFETADALFTVEKRELQLPTLERPIWGDRTTLAVLPFRHLLLSSELTPKHCSVLSAKQYEIVQNDSLLRMAEFIREEVDMDCVIVLADGAKVCFTATLRGAETDIVPGDTVKRRIVGYLGHDGKTGCGAKFTNIRVVCQNTLTAALSGQWCT